MNTHHFMFETILGGLKLTACGAIGLAAGTLAQVTIDHETRIPLGAACTLLVTAILAAMWLSRVLTKLSDRIEQMEGRIKGLSCVKEKTETCPVIENEP